jgi:transposase
LRDLRRHGKVVGMTVTLHHPDDQQRLEQLVTTEKNAKQRDRYRAVQLAMDHREGDDIARCVGRSPRFVDTWVARYRCGGIDALHAKTYPGRKPKLTPQQEQQLKTRLDAGPRDVDGVCTFRGKDICRIIQQEFGVVHTLGGIYDVLRRIGYSSLVPRPRHRKNDPVAMEAFERNAPLLPGR